MAVHSLQVTLAAMATQFTTQRTPCKQVIVQNNAAATMRIGDSTVSASKGHALAASGAANSVVSFGPSDAFDIDLSLLFVFGTAAQLLDVTYIK